MFAHTRKQIWELKWCLGICSALLVLLFIFLAVEQGAWWAVLMSAVYGTLFGSVLWSIMRHQHQQIARMEEWLLSFDAAAWKAWQASPRENMHKV